MVDIQLISLFILDTDLISTMKTVKPRELKSPRSSRRTALHFICNRTKTKCAKSNTNHKLWNGKNDRAVVATTTFAKIHHLKYALIRIAKGNTVHKRNEWMNEIPALYKSWRRAREVNNFFNLISYYVIWSWNAVSRSFMNPWRDYSTLQTMLHRATRRVWNKRNR